MTLEIDLLVLAILIGFSAFFSGIEVALVSIRKARVEQLVKQKVRGAKVLQKLKSDPGRMMARVLLGNDTVIRAVMMPRTKMFMLHSKMLLGEALPLINQSGHSRIPIYGKNRDEIVGIIHVRDILKQLEKDQKMIPLDEVAREPIFASQEKMVSSLLTEMKGRQMHMAIVIDEFGGVEGLVTLEDIIEEIVGEIRDKTDVDKHQEFHALNKNTIITNGDIE